MTSRSEHSATILLTRFRRDTDGAIAIFFGLLAVPLLMLSGLVIDYGVNSMAQQGLQDAADSTVISLLKLPVATTTAELQTRAENQIRAAAPRLVDADTKITVARVENTITVSVIAKSPTSMTRIAGYNSFPVSVTAAGIRGSGNLEIALVLDNTGSMSGSKITNLEGSR